MRRIRIQLPQVDKTYKTFLGADYSSGTSATVLNNASFAANDIGLFGEPTEELTELKKIDAISGTTVLTLASALSFAHGKGTSIYKVIWDYVSIEGRSTSAGTFAELTQSGLQYDNKNGETVYYHSAGTDTWEYRFRFYNSVTTTYSEYSPTLTGTGFTSQQVGFMIRNVRKVTGDEDRKIVSDDELIRFANTAQDIIYSHNPKYWFLNIDTYRAGTGIAVTDGTGVYSLATYTTFGHLDKVRYRYTSGGTDKLYLLDKKADAEFDALTTDLNRGEDDWITMYKLLPADSSSANGYIQVDPVPASTGVGTLYPKYYERMAELNSVDDETQVPLPDIIEDYMIAQVYKIKGLDSKAQIYEASLVSDSEDKVPSGLLMLDKLDNQQKSVSGQPRSLWNFRGRRFPGNMYGNRSQNADYYREFYMRED